MEFKDIFEIKKVPSVLFLVVAIVGAFLFYGGDYVLIKADPKTLIGFYVYVGWLVSCGLLVSNIIKFIIVQIRVFFLTCQIKRNYRKTLQNLDRLEVLVIREFFLQGRNSLDFPFDNPVITGLVNKSVILITSSFGGSSFILNGTRTTYTMNKFMREIIEPNIFFDLDKLSRKEIEDSRPSFVR